MGIDRTNVILGTILVYLTGVLISAYSTEKYISEISELEKKKDMTYERSIILQEIKPFIETKNSSNYGIKIDSLRNQINSIDSLIIDKKQKNSRSMLNSWKSWYTFFE